MNPCFNCDKPIKHGEIVVGFMTWMYVEEGLRFPQEMFNIVFHTTCFEEVAGEDYYDQIANKAWEYRNA